AAFSAAPCMTVCVCWFAVNGPAEPVVAFVGEDVILPAFLTPTMSAEGLEVRWFTSDFTSPVIFYRDNILRNEKQMNSYKGRTDLFLTELNLGNVSLKIRSVCLSDFGTYKCFVASKQQEGDVHISFIVVGQCQTPLISVSADEDGHPQLECTADGWSPEPVTSMSKMILKRNSEDYPVVSSSIPIKESFTVFSCLIRSSRPKPDWESKLHIGEYLQFVPFIANILITQLCFTHSEYGTKLGSILRWKIFYLWHLCKRTTSFNLRKYIQFLIPGKVLGLKSDVTFDPETANSWLIVSEDSKEVRIGDRRQRVTDNPKRFDLCPCVLAKEGFTSGRHYWEVEVGEKTAWTLGVARELVNRKRWIILSRYRGYWTVWLRNKNKYGALNDVPLPLRVKLQTVGVFLAYDEGQVSFYNAQSRTHLYTFTDSFTGTLYPYFNLCNNNSGKNTAPLVIQSTNQRRGCLLCRSQDSLPLSYYSLYHRHFSLKMQPF
uniref:B30.2/SPRY domain-containing protein n=1 Tax=Erpetoichthys calabaricus TaxID=27687 RepID=A0A8C4XFL5_ERPCA